jgi:hypothetical protein
MRVIKVMKTTKKKEEKTKTKKSNNTIYPMHIIQVEIVKTK